jgi:hypothetical protein
MGYAMKSEAEGGLGSYSPEMFADLDMGEYRTRFPEETANLTDEQLFHAVSHQDDDRDDDEWRAIFKAAE